MKRLKFNLILFIALTILTLAMNVLIRNWKPLPIILVNQLMLVLMIYRISKLYRMLVDHRNATMNLLKNIVSLSEEIEKTKDLSSFKEMIRELKTALKQF